MKNESFHKKVTLKISFADLFLKSNPEDANRARWEEWKKLCKEKDPIILSFWYADVHCFSCAHCDGDWCTLAGLPCSVNPYLSFNYGMPGLACIGGGFEPKQEELNLVMEPDI